MRFLYNKDSVDSFVENIESIYVKQEKLPAVVVTDIKRALEGTTFGLRLHFYKQLNERNPNLFNILAEVF
jgi:hypothetical protein